MIHEHNFLAKDRMIFHDHPSYSLDLTSLYFFLFSHSKRVVKGLNLEDIPEILQHVTSTLRVIPSKAYADSFVLWLIEIIIKGNRDFLFVSFLFFIL